jgi:hypothetical protein
MLRVEPDGAGGRYFKSRMVDVEYPTAEAAAEVLMDLYERQHGLRFGPHERARAVQMYVDNPGMSTEPVGRTVDNEFIAILACDLSGEACIETANAWGERKIAMRKALGLF